MVPSILPRLVGAAIAMSWLLAQEPVAPLQSGPLAGVVLPKCQVFAPSGPFAGQEFDVAARLGKAPGAILFVHELTRNTGPMIGGLDRLGGQLAWTGLQVFTVRIAADRTEAELGSKRSSEAMGLHRPLLVSVDGAEGPGAYALHRKATLTLVLCKDGLVTRSVAFTDTGRADLGKLRALVEEVTGPVPTDPGELQKAMEARLARDPESLRAMVIELTVMMQKLERAEQNRMQRQAAPAGREAADGGAQPRPDPARPREGKAPEDEELRALLRRCIQRAADDAELTAVFAAIDARIGTDAGLKAQAIDMFKLMISLDYGTDDARRRAREFLTRHAPK
jgi:hypothetical protein